VDNTTVLNSDSIANPNLKYKLQPWVVVFSAALFFFYEFIQMNMFNSISAQLMESFHVTATQLGNLSATYLYADVVFLLPAGIILDRISVRKVILAAMTLCVVGTVLFSQATALWFAASCHFMAGIGNAFSFLSCMILASRWFPPRRLALVTGLIVTFAMAGGMIAQTPLTIIVQHIGWRDAVLFNGVLGLVLLFINWMFIQNSPNGNDCHKTKTNEMPFLRSIALAVKNIHTWLYALYTSLLNLPIMVLGALWGVLALTQLHDLTKSKASMVTSMIFLGTIIGGPIIGWISDRIALRKMPMIICALLSLIVMLMIIYLPGLNFAELIILFFLLGLFTSAQVVSYPAITENNSRKITGTAMGIASVVIMGGAAIAQLSFGWLLDKNWNGVLVHGKPVYTGADFNAALIMIPCAFVIGLIAILFARETFCKPVPEKL
jgi:MFS family permease